MLDKAIRVLTWTIFGLGFVLVLLVSLLASLTGRPLFAQPGTGVRSKVKVSLPVADADLFIESKLTKTTGKQREFDTPDMERGKRYEYEVRATWKPNAFTTITRVRNVKFSGGDEVAVDLTEDDGTDRVAVALKPLTADAVADVIAAAKVAKGDVVFVPHAADAKLLAAAAKAGAKRAVGVQIDPDKLAALRAAVRAFAQEGAIDVLPVAPAECKDYAEATAVLLYQGDELNLALRPVLLRDLKPGARIASYRFAMGDWKPTKTTKGVNADGDEYELHTWVVTDADKKAYGKK